MDGRPIILLATITRLNHQSLLLMVSKGCLGGYIVRTPGLNGNG